MSDWTVNPEVAEEARAWTDVDDRLGDHDSIVTQATMGAWDDGRSRIDLRVELLTANHAKASTSISEPANSADLAAVKAEGQKGRARGMALNNTIISQLKEYYDMTPDQIKEGDRFETPLGNFICEGVDVVNREKRKRDEKRETKRS